MVAQQQAPRYADPVYQTAHDETYNTPIVKGIPFVLPPGVSKAEFDKAIAELAAGLGQDAVFTGEALKEYVDPYEIPESGHGRNIPSAAVWYVFAPEVLLSPPKVNKSSSPTSVEELQKALKIVNAYRIPVWTVSRGKNLG